MYYSLDSNPEPLTYRQQRTVSKKENFKNQAQIFYAMQW